jgi:hypothetical protein
MTNPLRQAVTSPPPNLTQQEICDHANARMLADPGGRRDIRWIIVGGQMKLEFIR